MGAWLRGGAAALSGLGAAELLAAALGGPSLIDAAGKLVVDTSPLPVVEQTVKLLRAADKPVTRAAVVGTVVGAGALLGQARRPVTYGLAAGAAAAAAAGLALRRPGSGEMRDTRATAAVLSSAATGAAATVTALSAPTPRVRALALTGGAALAASLRLRELHRRRHAAAQSARLPPVASPLPPARDGAEAWNGVSPLLTPVEDFYVTDVTMRPLLIDTEGWELDVSGACTAPYRLSYDQLLAGDLVEFDAVLSCVHNRLGWDRLGNQRWTGIPLHTLLDKAAPNPTARYVVTRAVDGWECSLPLLLLERTAGYLVVGMAGRPLTAAHGFPARVFVPGLYGQFTGAKWLTGLRLAEHPNTDYWLPRGWPREPVPVRPLARIDSPAPGRVNGSTVTCTGVAWAPPHGVTAVEARVDGGPWQTAELAAELAPAAWRRWRLHLPLTPGKRTLQARCTSRDGTRQSPVPRTPFPTGTSGYHTVTITAR
ncbi:molybdopterin-dependent oxidoreductase [Streptomyces sp. NPDC005799]|uniref:molybdopterin-dependent oxidoreductase n=1 Tax=Streptomyces sp. NPDC005799 TaxID=3154678 RepID=UPI0033F1B57F